VVKRRRDLDQSLQESLLWFLGLQPDAFPVLVSLKKFLAPIASETFGKRSATPVKRHPPLIIIENHN